MPMDWNELMSHERISALTSSSRRSGSKDSRSEFEKDWDKIVFSSAFRNLHDKTQVFPFPAANDFVHSRLAHSLEVACVGRSLGTIIGTHVCQRRRRPSFTPADVGTVVASACLAHDIGNAPLGHEGENAIRDFFGAHPIDFLDKRETLDLRSFDGNPQGFRVLTRLLSETDGGLRLTAATLGAFTKYPWASTSSESSATKSLAKFGYFKAETHPFRRMAKATGLMRKVPKDGVDTRSRSSSKPPTTSAI
jgi:dGTPase